MKMSKENSNNNYYEYEINKILPVDEYGIKIQLSSTKGKTKQFMLNKASFSAIKKLIKKMNTKISSMTEILKEETK